MPALKLFGRKWLAASDDLVFPCIFEVLWRLIFLTFTSIIFQRYWTFLQLNVAVVDVENNFTQNVKNEPLIVYCSQQDVIFIKSYFIGLITILVLNIPLLIVMIKLSAKGAICDVKIRRHVTPLLYIKLFLILPEVAINMMGTLWVFFEIVKCINIDDTFANTTLEVCTVFYWIVLCLILFAIMIAYDPLGAKKYRTINQDSNGNINSANEHHELMHKKISKLWLRRFRLAFCCLAKDENGEEAFLQSAELFSNLFNGTDLVPSDMIAGSILMRVRQKKENREYRRIQILNDMSCPRYSSDISRIFSTPQCPSWMTLRNAQHFLRFAVSSYGWPMLCALAPCKACCGLTRKITCCAGLRNKSDHVVDDNCCNCNEAGARITSRVESNDIIYASFKNQVFEIPFIILADHSTKSIVVSIRGSWSISDIFTDLAAQAEEFTAAGFPDNTFVHYGVTKCCNQIIKTLTADNLLDKVLEQYPNYELVLTGHSLGAALAILVGAKLRSKYRDLKVYGYGTPSGVITREAAKYTEQFAFSVIIGDDCFARISVEAVEYLKNSILESLQSCRLPKYRVILNGFAYALLGIPSRDLEKTWYDINEISHSHSATSSTLLNPQIIATISNEASLLYNNATGKFRPKLFNCGKILHIMRKKKSEIDKKSTQTSIFEMRWAQPEDFTELKIMPRMMLDHFPQNIMKVLTRILNERKNGSVLSVNEI
ncbi:hypothetical protein PVAND_008185 [Polypedilum vanderplanki]|uniref:sn-1-specific diacylglycerol lipase n=1 Tax=Polypedilum vanderplanki TaxID=319348 RepID=A0A9J6CA72_POLVA|nr:hypothetical protein PVAND_008185 [Polypedilum vanderplanki]